MAIKVPHSAANRQIRLQGLPTGTETSKEVEQVNTLSPGSRGMSFYGMLAHSSYDAHTPPTFVHL